MSTIYINTEPCTLLASVRPAGQPFEEQDGSLVGLDISTANGGGYSNLRMTPRQAMALRDCLFAYFQRGPLTHTIAEHKDGKLVSEEQTSRYRHTKTIELTQP